MLPYPVKHHLAYEPWDAKCAIGLFDRSDCASSPTGQQVTTHMPFESSTRTVIHVDSAAANNVKALQCIYVRRKRLTSYQSAEERKSWELPDSVLQQLACLEVHTR